MIVPELEFVTKLEVELAPIIEMGEGSAGKRRIVPIVGGTMSGPKLNGKVLNVGADWQTVFSNGQSLLDTRYALETNDGATIEILNFGYRHGPDEVMAAVARGEDVPEGAYYMRTHARLETGDERYAWVNKTLFVGSGSRQKSSVVMNLFAIL